MAYNYISLAMRIKFIKTLTFYAILFYILYKCFFAGDEEISKDPDLPIITQESAETDKNIIVRMLSLVFSIIPWLFSCIWSVLGFFWSIATFLWGIINHIWTFSVVLVNVAYTLIIITIISRNRPKSVEYFLTVGAGLLLIPLVVNWLILRPEITFNLLLPIYLTIFVASSGQGPLETSTAPRNLVFFVAVCALL
jgi:hypothetical protein